MKLGVLYALFLEAGSRPTRIDPTRNAMSDFESTLNANIGLRPTASQKDLDTVFGSPNLRGSYMRPPAASIPAETITTFERVLASDLNCDGRVTVTPCAGGVRAEMEFTDQNISVVGRAIVGEAITGGLRGVR